MSVRGESNTTQIRRLALRQMELGLTEIDSALADECTDAAIHAVRVRLKRTRALLRLLAHAVAPNHHVDPAALDQCLRDLHHRLGSHRDQAVLRATARHVFKRCGDDLASHNASELELRLTSALYEAAAAAEVLTPAEVVVQVRCQFMRLRRAIQACEPGRFDDAQVLDAAADDYRQARRRLRRARRDHRPENLHALRKSVKRLGYHRRLLHPIWPADWPLDCERIERLGDRLGRHQDVCLLLDALQRPDLRTQLGDLDALAAFEQIGHEYRRDLARRCRRLARKTLRPAPDVAHDRPADAYADLAAV